MSVFLINIKSSINSAFLFDVFLMVCKVYACVTTHGGRSLSLMSVNWVIDEVGIDFLEYMHIKGVCF